MRDELGTILRLVAEGKLSAEEAAPIIEALSPPHERHREEHTAPGMATRRARRVRIQVTEHGRRVVDLRVPLTFAAIAARSVPGIPEAYADMIERAVEGQTEGTIVDTEDESGDRVVISVE